MTNKIWKAAATLCLAGLAIGSTVLAQGPGTKMKAHVPFGFEAGRARLTAGEYTVEQRSSGILVLRNEESAAAAMILVVPAQRTSRIDEGYLVFHKIGDNYFLSKVWTPGKEYGGQLSPSKHEKEMASAPVAGLLAEIRIPIS